VLTEDIDFRVDNKCIFITTGKTLKVFYKTLDAAESALLLKIVATPNYFFNTFVCSTASTHAPSYMKCIHNADLGDAFPREEICGRFLAKVLTQALGPAQGPSISGDFVAAWTACYCAVRNVAFVDRRVSAQTADTLLQIVLCTPTQLHNWKSSAQYHPLSKKGPEK
jgi:hypothetical protein